MTKWTQRLLAALAVALMLAGCNSLAVQDENPKSGQKSQTY